MDVVADAKKFVHPTGKEKFTGSQFSYLHGIRVNKKLHFKITRDSRGRGVIRTKATSLDLSWSKTYYISQKKELIQLDLNSFPPNATKTHCQETLDDIKDGLSS